METTPQKRNYTGKPDKLRLPEKVPGIWGAGELEDP